MSALSHATILPALIVLTCLPGGAAQEGAAAQPEMKTLKATFIPGEKTLFYDDFTDMTADDPPPHFKIRGAAPELRAAGDLRQLTITKRGSLFPNLTNLPSNFTFETEIKADV